MHFFVKIPRQRNIFPSTITMALRSYASSKSNLESLSKSELVQKVLSLQCNVGQLMNQKTENSSRYRKMIAKLNHSKNSKKSRKFVGGNSRKCRYVALKIAYLGWDYDGLQSNPNLDDSIENILRGALMLTRLVDESDPVKFTRCGRTDKGVSAAMQVMTLKVYSRLKNGPGIMSYDDPSLVADDNEDTEPHATDSCFGENPGENQLDSKPSVAVEFSGNGTSSPDDNCTQTSDTDADKTDDKFDDISVNEYDYVNMLNRVLPDEVRVLAWSPLEDQTFSARRNCLSREYCYYFPRGNADINKMNSAAKLFCGLNDYRNVCKLNVASCTTYVRRIFSFNVKTCGTQGEDSSPFDLCYAHIVGSGFVYHQVRSMMSILFLIGIGKEDPSVITSLLDVQQCTSKPTYGLVKGEPLVLHHASFSPMKWRVSRDNYARVLRHFQSCWSDLAVKAQITKDLVHALEIEGDVQLESLPADFLVTDGNILSCQQLSDHLNATEPVHGVNKLLLQDSSSLKAERYQPVMTRPRGKQLEDHIEHFEGIKKRRVEAGNNGDS